MIPKIEKKYRHLENSLEEILAYMDNLNEEELTQAPPEVWSPAQVLYHLWQSEDGTRSYLEKKLQADPETIEKTSLSNSLKATVLKKALNSRKRKFRVPKVLGELPVKPDYAELKISMRETRTQLEKTLEKFDSNKANRAYFKHPVAGKLNIFQTMDFLTAHFDRHAAQIKERTKK